jgi:hypothetical protein
VGLYVPAPAGEWGACPPGPAVPIFCGGAFGLGGAHQEQAQNTRGRACWGEWRQPPPGEVGVSVLNCPLSLIRNRKKTTA